MKSVRASVIILTIVVVMFLSGCEKLSPSNTIRYNGDGKLCYNGKIYVECDDMVSWKFHFDSDSVDCVEIAVRPGLLYVFGQVHKYYGNDLENPEYICILNPYKFYVREDLKIDFDSMLTIQDTEETYSFRISDIITDKKIDFESYGPEITDNGFKEICDFNAWIEPDNFAYLWITVLEKDGSYYLQDAWDSDLYLLKDGFETELARLGLIGRTEGKSGDG